MSGERTGSASDVTQREFVGGQRLFGRYTLIRILGRGGMGIVWLAHKEKHIAENEFGERRRKYAVRTPRYFRYLTGFAEAKSQHGAKGFP